MKTTLLPYALAALSLLAAGCARPPGATTLAAPALQVDSLQALGAMAPRLDRCARSLSGPALPAALNEPPALQMALPSRVEPGLASHGHYVYLAGAPAQRQVYLVTIGGMVGSRSVFGPVREDWSCLA